MLLLVWTGLVVTVTIGFVIALISNVFAAKFDYDNAKPKRKLRRSQKQEVTVLIPAFNEESVIIRCLKSVNELNYFRIRIIVIDDASSDKTSALVRTYAKSSRLPVRLITLKNNRGKGGAMNYALKKYINSEITLILDADCTIHPDALTHMMQEFKDKTIAGVASNVRIAKDPSLLSYLQAIEFILGFRAKRALDSANAEFIIGGQGAAYRTSAIINNGGFRNDMQTEDITLSLGVLSHPTNNEYKIAFAANSLIYTEAVPSLTGLFKQRYRWKIGALQSVMYHSKNIQKSKRMGTLLKWYRLPQLFIGEFMALFEPLIVALLILIAFSAQSVYPILGGWISFSLYVTTVLVIDEHTKWKDRIGMSLFSILLFPLFYTFSVINFIGVIKVIRNWRQIIGRAEISGSWQPPRRVGKTALQ